MCYIHINIYIYIIHTYDIYIYIYHIFHAQKNNIATIMTINFRLDKSLSERKFNYNYKINRNR